MLSATTLPQRRNDKERLILSLLRRHRQLPKAELARYTALSPTAIGSIIKQLEDDGLVLRGEPQRGRVGQPSVPYRIAPEGSFAFGLKIGRRSAELVLLNALMEVVAVAEAEHDHPEPASIAAFVQAQTQSMLDAHGGDIAERVCGLGIAMPYGLWQWAQEMDAPAGALDAWRDFDPAAEWSQLFGWPVLVANDATSACAAELALNADQPPANALYFFVGWFIGGGIILNGKVHEGSRANAGAIGSMPVSVDGGAPDQLIRIASLFTLERELLARGEPLNRLWRRDLGWDDLGEPLAHWLEQAARSIARAIAAASAVIDFESAIVDGSMPEAVRHSLLQRIRQHHAELDLRGLSTLDIAEGRVGRNARAIGAACLLLLDAYAVELGELPTEQPPG